MNLDFDKMNKPDLINYIKDTKKRLGNKIFIPVHHYQGEEIIQFADVVGDSYKLALEASKTQAEIILFCGVRFMAEGASILSKIFQKIVMPDISAGCPMADMANLPQVENIFNRLKKETDDKVTPVLYINSYADLKDFCGKNNGSICTSSNAEIIIRHYLKQGKSIFFMPDYFLGINTALKIGIDEKHIAKINKDLTVDAKTDLKNIKFFLWHGYCPIHEKFSVSDINYLRSMHKDIKIIVHPESGVDVVNNSDLSGSTEKIYNAVKDSPAGSVWGIGTETTFVNRLAGENKNKTIIPLKSSACPNMMKTTIQKMAASLESIDDYFSGKSSDIKNEIQVKEIFKDNAKKALNKMIEIVESSK